MFYFAIAYVALTVLGVVSVLVLQVPSVLGALTVVTFGLSWLLGLAVLNATLWLTVFLPTVLAATLRWQFGLAVALMTVAALMSFESWVPGPRHNGAALLGEAQAAQGPAEARSVELEVAELPRTMQEVEDPTVRALLRNSELDWLRLRMRGYTRLFMRKNGVMYLEDVDHGRVADVIVERPGAFDPDSGYVPERWRSAPLSPWKIDAVRGYLVYRGQGGAVLARNLSLQVSLAVVPLRMNLTGIDVAPMSRARSEFVRAPHARIEADPARALEDELRALALIGAPEAPSEGEAGDVFNAPEALDAVIVEMLKDPERSGLPRVSGSASYTFHARQVYEEFTRQLENRVAIPERIDLIVQLYRAHIRIDGGLLMALAREEPALMQRLVEVSFTELETRHRAVAMIRKLRKDEDLAPLLRAMGRDPDRLRALLLGDTPGVPQRLTEMIFRFELDDPYALLAELFQPMPPESDLATRLSPGYRDIWMGETLAQLKLSELGTGYVSKTNAQDLADRAIMTIIGNPDVPEAVVLDFVGRWVLTRHAPIWHDPEVIVPVLERLDGLESDEAEALAAALRVYFQDVLAALR